jgi:hypothetical protein
MVVYRGHKFNRMLNFRLHPSMIEEWKKLVDEAIATDRSVGYVARMRVFPNASIHELKDIQ